MISFIFLCFLIFFSSFVSSSESESTFRVRLTSDGLRFFSNIGHRILNYEIWNIDFSSTELIIEDGPGSGSVTLRNLKVENFDSPVFTFKPVHPDGIAWKSKNGEIKLSGRWEVEYKVVFTFYFSGYMVISLSDLRTLLRLGIFADQGKPQFKIDQCQISIGSVDIQLSGGVIPWIVNLFHTKVSSFIKQQIEDKLCGVMQTSILYEANNDLLSLPSRFQTFHNLFINYNYQQNLISKANYVEANVYIDVVFGNRSCNLPVKSVKLGVNGTKRMLHIWLSDHIANCLAKTAYDADELVLIVDKSFEGGKFKDYLRTSCAFWQVCIGRFLPQLEKRYPNRSVLLHLYAKERPFIKTSHDGIRIRSTLLVDMLIDDNAQSLSESHHSISTNDSKFSHRMGLSRLAQLAVNATSVVIPTLLNDKISGSISYTLIDIRELYSIIGHFDPEIVNFLNRLLASIIKYVGDAVLAKGFPLPILDNVTFTDDASIFTGRDFLRIDSDLVYHG
ncbi:hypothetical protein AB6A40_000721 [Gnathostoma spinigerum]|uniref:Uncharacterized protein n=1 Tax=Gnathostoma spinigerum TaxID=75299 RepID=A0ABD6EBF4_9BILA